MVFDRLQETFVAVVVEKLAVCFFSSLVQRVSEHVELDPRLSHVFLTSSGPGGG